MNKEDRLSGWEWLWRILDSKILLLLVAVILAGNLAPSWLRSSEDMRRERQAEADARRWQYEAREDMLLSVDKATCVLLDHVLTPERFRRATLADLEEDCSGGVEEMNYAMVRIRLLYGTPAVR